LSWTQFFASERPALFETRAIREKHLATLNTNLISVEERMGDPTPDIEVELRRPIVTEEQANQQRRRLKESFSSLNQDQAAELLERLLTWGGSRLPSDFRRLHRVVRLELATLLATKLGTQASQSFQNSLNARHDTTLKKGLRVMFPDYAKTQRDKFLRNLGRPPSGVPTVLLEFRNKDGETFSWDNQCKGLFNGTFSTKQLGVIPNWGFNQEEIRGTVHAHRPDAEYRFDRTLLLQKRWFRATDAWRRLHDSYQERDSYKERIIPGSDEWWKLEEPRGPFNDRATNNREDEDVRLTNDHIYSIDGPGFNNPLLGFSVSGSTYAKEHYAVDPSQITDVVTMINFTESVMFKLGGGTWTRAAGLDWFTVTWLEQVGGNWRRKPQKNAIRQGFIKGLDRDDAIPPNMHF
jgi:hypothetical protein